METGETDFRKVPNLVESSKVIDLNPIAPVARCLTSIHQSMVDLLFTYAWHNHGPASWRRKDGFWACGHLGWSVSGLVISS